MRILVCGTRDWPGAWEDIGIYFPGEPESFVVIHGACSRIRDGVQVSVDMIADFIARQLGHEIERYPVDHAKDGPWPGAGPRRNERMLRNGRPDRGLAFGALWVREQSAMAARRLRPGGWKHTGTGGMTTLMLDARLPLRWIAAPGVAPIDLTAMPEPPT